MTDNEINFEPEFTICPEGGYAEIGCPICFDIAGEDVNWINDLHITLIEGPGEYTEEVGGQGGFASGVWCWDDPVLGDYTVVLELNDNAGGIAHCEFEISVLETVAGPEAPLPTPYALAQNFPNPFNSSTTLNYRLAQSVQVKISVYDILGQRVAILSEGIEEAGSHSVVWNASNFSSGVYFARLEADGISKTIRMLLLK